MVEPGLTSKSSGTRYGMVLCLGAVCCSNSRASYVVIMSILARTRDPKSITTGLTPSSAIIILPTPLQGEESRRYWQQVLSVLSDQSQAPWLSWQEAPIYSPDRSRSMQVVLYRTFIIHINTVERDLTWFDIAMSVCGELSYFFLFCCRSFFVPSRAPSPYFGRCLANPTISGLSTNCLRYVAYDAVFVGVEED